MNRPDYVAGFNARPLRDEGGLFKRNYQMKIGKIDMKM